MLLLHGGSSRRQAFDSILPELAASYHVYAPDLRGHGQSSWTLGRYRLQDYTDDIVRFLRHHVTEPVFLFGHSLGGMVALMTAAQYPSGTRAVAVGDSPLSGESWLYELQRSRDRLLTWRALSGGQKPLVDLIEAIKDSPVEVPGQAEPLPLRTVMGETSPVFAWLATNIRQNDPDMLSALLDRYTETAAGYEIASVLPVSYLKFKWTISNISFLPNLTQLHKFSIYAISVSTNPVQGRSSRSTPPFSGTTSRLQEMDVPPAVASLLANRETIEDHIVMHVLADFQQEIQKRRDHETGIKEKYGLRSLDHLIQESNGKILDDLRQALGESVELPLLNERCNLESRQQRRQELQREIRMERNLTIGEFRILGAAAVALIVEKEAVEPQPVNLSYPEPQEQDAPDITHDGGVEYEVISGGAAMRRDDEIEAVGMCVAMAYEQAQGWQPEDIAHENKGFDIRSMRWTEDGTVAGIRYIEVKARARSGEVRITANEWKMGTYFCNASAAACAGLSS